MALLRASIGLDSHRDAVDGLVLWASYSAADISSAAVPVASIYGTLDAGVPSFTSAANTAKLGPRLTLTPIEGGNHEQIGWYTGQPNDPPATISREAAGAGHRRDPRPARRTALIVRRPGQGSGPT